MKHVILISLDTLRFDCIGYQPDKRELEKFDVLKYLETPTLDTIAGHSLCFTQCTSTNTYTTAAHASIMTGLYPSKHGVRAFYQSKLHKDVFTIAEILKVFGYTTILATDTPVNFLPLNLGKGFDQVFEADDPGVISFLEKHKDEKIFLFAHFFDIHDPYLMSMQGSFSNDDYFSAVQSLYEQFDIPFPSGDPDGWAVWGKLSEQTGRKKDIFFPLYVQGVTKFDQNRFKSFYGSLKELNMLEEGLLVIFSDHGEGRGPRREPDDFWHGGNVVDNVIRVPLIISHRDLRHSVLDSPVSLVDIFPTTLSLATGKDANTLLPYSVQGRSLFDSGEREWAYCETSRSINMLGQKGYKLDFTLDCSQMSSFLLQRAIRTRDRKFILYGEPEGLLEEGIDGMDDSEFLKALYRKHLCRFESYDEYLKTLGMLKSGEVTRLELFRRHKTERFEVYDLQNDPFEEQPLTDWHDTETLSLHRSTILDISVPAVRSEDIFPPLNREVVRRISGSLLLDENEETLRVVTGNKNLFNELIMKFLKNNSSLTDEEFLRKCYRIFLDREHEGEYFKKLLQLLKQGVAKETVFMTGIFQYAEFREAEPPGMQVAAEKTTPGLEHFTALEENIKKKEALICELEDQLNITDDEIQNIRATKTWKLGQLYGKLFGAEAKWRK